HLQEHCAARCSVVKYTAVAWILFRLLGHLLQPFFIQVWRTFSRNQNYLAPRVCSWGFISERRSYFFGRLDLVGCIPCLDEVAASNISISVPDYICYLRLNLARSRSI